MHFDTIEDMQLERPTLRVESGGTRPLVTKAAPEGPAADRLRHELAVLRRVQHPGVVALIDSVDEPEQDAGALVVRTRFCGSRTLATVGDLNVGRAAGLVAALATTVAELHELGVAHSRLTPDHVLLAGDGRPVLCGFGDAQLEASEADCADDVAALGALLRDLIVDAEDAMPIPAHALGGRRGWTGYQRRSLLNLADLATADEPARRPSARQFAQQVRSAAPGASLGDDIEPTDDATTDPDDPSRSRLVLVGCVAAVVITIAGVGLARAVPQHSDEARPTATSQPNPSHPTSPQPAPSVDEPDHRPIETEPAGTEPAETEPALHPWHEVSGCSTTTGGPSTRRNGSVCEDVLTFEAGRLTVGSHTFEIDLVDAVAAVGRFSCDQPTAAILDLESGGIFVFTGWARPEEPAVAEQAGAVSGARRLLVEPDDGGRCDRLVALDEFGIRHTIDPPSRGEP